MSKQKTDEWGTPESIFKLLPTGAYFDPCPSYNQPRVSGHDKDRVTTEDSDPVRGFIDGLECDW